MRQEIALDKKKSLSAIATGREVSFFEHDFKTHWNALNESLNGKRVLAIGGAGSIGSSTVHQITNFNPSALHIVDQNENGLTELVRQFRSRSKPTNTADFRALPLDYGAAAFRYFLFEQPVYDVVLNFAALKHVRSEKDPFSTLQMFETNLTKQIKLIRWLADTGFEGRFFTVSTDKAANPSSMMGASKRVMEHVMFNSSAAANLKGIKTSARFANVAFSNGSLLQGFQHRLARGEPLAAPANTSRYFVSMEESGEICTLASMLAHNNSIIVPKLNPEEHLIEMQEIAERFLILNGLTPTYFSDEQEACVNVESARQRNHWPLLITQLNTAGEKPYEEFVANGEKLVDAGFSALQAVPYLPAPRLSIDAMLDELEAIIAFGQEELSKDMLKKLLGQVEPTFLSSHRDSELSLDQRA